MPKLSPASISGISHAKYKNFLKADLADLSIDSELKCFYVEDHFKKGEDLFVVPKTWGDWDDFLEENKYSKGKATRTGESAIKLLMKNGFRDVDNLLNSFGWDALTEKEATEEEKQLEAQTNLLKRMEFLNGEAEGMLRGKSDPENGITDEVISKIGKFQGGIRTYVKKTRTSIPELDKINELAENLELAWTRITDAIEKAKEALTSDEQVVNDVIFLDVSESTVKKYDDEGHLSELKKFALTDRHKSEPLIGVPQHHHLDNGSKGIAFTYRKEENGSITPIVYDYASGRSNSGTGNSYSWKNNSASSGPPKLPSGAK